VSVIQTRAEGALFAAEAIHKAGDHDLIAFDVHWHQQGLARAVDYLLASRVEGVLLASLDGAEPLIGEAIRRLKAARLPLVSMGGTVEPGIPWVGTDYFQGGRLLGEHLVAQGRRKVAFLTSSGHLRFASVTQRLDGLKSAFEQAGGTVETILGSPPTEPDDAVSLKNFASGDLAFTEMLARKETFDAVVCINDYAALAVIRACHDHGIRTPDDLAVTGFDDTALARFTTPRLTTVAQPIREAADKAVELLFAAIRGKPHPADRPLELPCELVVRESCGARQERYHSL